LHDSWLIIIIIIIIVVVVVVVVELRLRTLYFRLYTVQLFNDFWIIN